MNTFKKICKNIKTIKIQGARNIAKAALQAYSLNPTNRALKTLLNLRPTEPMLQNTLKMLSHGIPKKQILEHFDLAQKRINSLVFRIIKNNSIIFTHCHSTNVANALIYAKKKGKRFQVYNTETRPLFQGRLTAKQLSKAGIKVTTFIDAAASLAIQKSNMVFLGADAILKNGDVINKIGSGMFSEIAYDFKKPVYIIADSWKFAHGPEKIEERSFKEIWKNVPKHVKIKNPSFEIVKSKYITAIISELGISRSMQFIKKLKT